MVGRIVDWNFGERLLRVDMRTAGEGFGNRNSDILDNGRRRLYFGMWMDPGIP